MIMNNQDFDPKHFEKLDYKKSLRYIAAQINKGEFDHATDFIFVTSSKDRHVVIAFEQSKKISLRLAMLNFFSHVFDGIVSKCQKDIKEKPELEKKIGSIFALINDYDPAEWETETKIALKFEA
jgi:hypothetical protein